MNDKLKQGVWLDVDRLQPGIFISLTDHWLDHPFLFNEFRISNQKQIETLREMRLEKVLCFPERSTALPLPARAPAPIPAPPPQPSAEELAALADKRRRVERIRATRDKIARCEKQYAKTAGAIRNLMQRLHASPRQAAEMAQAVVDETVASLISTDDTVLHLIGQKHGDDNAYFHALNVMVLALILGQSDGLDEASLRDIGMGALFHDLGKLRVPAPILKKGRERNRMEEDFYRLHTVYGKEIGAETGVLSAGALDIIEHHHEHVDASGFPHGLGEDGLSLPARIVAIANRYDNLCNDSNQGGLTPAEALSQMFRKEGSHWDTRLLQRFIKNLGVFPPGSIVQLSNGVIGLVMTVNRKDLLRPSVMVYDKNVPRNEANIVNLADIPEVRIDSALRRDVVPAEALDYLAPRRVVVYFYDGPDSP